LAYEDFIYTVLRYTFTGQGQVNGIGGLFMQMKSLFSIQRILPFSSSSEHFIVKRNNFAAIWNFRKLWKWYSSSAYFSDLLRGCTYEQSNSKDLNPALSIIYEQLHHLQSGEAADVDKVLRGYI